MADSDTGATMEVCEVAGLKNLTSSAKPYSWDQWMMQTPNGQVVAASIVESTFGFGSLVSGGTTAGNICFDEPAAFQHGQFVFIFQPAGSASRGVWLAAL